MANKVDKATAIVGGPQFSGRVTTPKPAWARRVAITQRGLRLGLDRFLEIERNGDVVSISVTSKDGDVMQLVRVNNHGFKMANKKMGYKRVGCGISFAVEGEEFTLDFERLEMKDGVVTGAFKLKPSDAPHFYAEFALRLVGWTEPEKFTRWRCV